MVNFNKHIEEYREQFKDFSQNKKAIREFGFSCTNDKILLFLNAKNYVVNKIKKIGSVYHVPLLEFSFDAWNNIESTYNGEVEELENQEKLEDKK